MAIIHVTGVKTGIFLKASVCEKRTMYTKHNRFSENVFEYTHTFPVNRLRAYTHRNTPFNQKCTVRARSHQIRPGDATPEDLQKKCAVALPRTDIYL